VHVWNGSGWDMLLMALSMTVFWGALVAVVALAFRRDRRPERETPDAVERLRRRYAEGEIPLDDYEQRLRVLEGSSR
jgi:putative membrane protein